MEKAPFEGLGEKVPTSFTVCAITAALSAGAFQTFKGESFRISVSASSFVLFTLLALWDIFRRKSPH